MLNDTSASCKNCMILIRMLTLKYLSFNMRVFAWWIRDSENGLSDSLSRMQFKRFWTLAKKQGRVLNDRPTPLPREMWPPEKLWSQ